MAQRVETVNRGRRIRVVKRHTARRQLPELDLRTPSGRHSLPY
jgi:hypothetical protein